MQLSLIQNKICEIRRQKVMIDRDLAALYGVETRALDQAAKRNPGRFPRDFMLRLTKEEPDGLMSQDVISKKPGSGGTRKLPLVFREPGMAMLSSKIPGTGNGSALKHN